MRARAHPDLRDFQGVQRKVEEMTRRHAGRERELEMASLSVKEQFESERFASEQRYGVMLQRKNTQIAKFQTDLNALLVELARLRGATHTSAHAELEEHGASDAHSEIDGPYLGGDGDAGGGRGGGGGGGGGVEGREDELSDLMELLVFQH